MPRDETREDDLRDATASQADWLRRWQGEKDPECLNQLLKSEIRIVKEMVQRRAPSLLGTMGATDIAHEAVLGLLRAKTLPEFESPAGLRSYLWKSAWRLLLARLEARNRRPARVDVTSVDSLKGVFAGTREMSDFDSADIVTAIEVAMNLLSGEDREILEVIHFQEKSVAEAALRFGISREAASMRATRARRRLKERLRGFAEVIGSS